MYVVVTLAIEKSGGCYGRASRKAATINIVLCPPGVRTAAGAHQAL